MKFTEAIKIYADAPYAKFAAELFENELKSRANLTISFSEDKSDSEFCFVTDDSLGKDEFIINEKNNGFIFNANGKRGFIFAVGKFLRNIIKSENGFETIGNICRKYSPDKAIRGHQIGYRTTPNTYDAWTYEDYRRYYIDLMFFGANTVEHIPYQSGVSKRNKLMHYDEEEFLVVASEMADEYDLDVSLWHPNYDNETDESAAERRGKLYSKLKRLDYVFVPGGDPGDLPSDVLINRCKAISKELRKSHPEAQMWPSAQMPDGYPDWADVFIRELEKEPDEINGVIFGPNHAMPLKELRERVPEKYPIRFYPDITHNVRCEYPVHYHEDDWHYALVTGLSRECTNPRPYEYTDLYNETKDYVVGSVSYSEGITDDPNKAVWSALDYDNSSDTCGSLREYCRLFFFGADNDKIAQLISGLEKNWVGAPEDNKSIENVYNGFRAVAAESPFLAENWRFVQLLLRAICDKFIRDRRIFELDIIEKSGKLAHSGDFADAKEVLSRELPGETKALRIEISELCDKMFRLIGLQTDIEHYCADNWERGAILETIDLPSTDRAWLLNRWGLCSEDSEIIQYFDRNKVGDDEYYFSVALNGIHDKQQGEVYMNFMGDRPTINKGDLHTSLFNVFDNFNFVHTFRGLSRENNYKLRVTYLNHRDDDVKELKITINGNQIYCGPQYGKPDEEYNKKFCKDTFTCAVYDIPKEYIDSESNKLEFYEPIMGIMISELSITKQ